MPGDLTRWESSGWRGLSPNSFFLRGLGVAELGTVKRRQMEVQGGEQRGSPAPASPGLPGCSGAGQRRSRGSRRRLVPAGWSGGVRRHPQPVGPGAALGRAKPLSAARAPPSRPTHSQAQVPPPAAGKGGCGEASTCTGKVPCD